MEIWRRSKSNSGAIVSVPPPISPADQASALSVHGSSPRLSSACTETTDSRSIRVSKYASNNVRPKKDIFVQRFMVVVIFGMLTVIGLILSGALGLTSRELTIRVRLQTTSAVDLHGPLADLLQLSKDEMHIDRDGSVH